jgi:hypothetical protein
MGQVRRKVQVKVLEVLLGIEGAVDDAVIEGKGDVEEVYYLDSRQQADNPNK